MSNELCTISARITAVRRTLGMSQSRFAKGLKLSDSHIAKIEMGKRRAHDRIIKIISVVYGVNEKWLKNGEGLMFDSSEDFKSAQIIDIFKKLDPLFQDYLIQQLDRLLEIQGILKKQEEKND